MVYITCEGPLALLVLVVVGEGADEGRGRRAAAHLCQAEARQVPARGARRAPAMSYRTPVHVLGDGGVWV